MTRLRISNLSKGVTEQGLIDLFRPYGTVSDPMVIQNESGLNSGSVIMENQTEAKNAIVKLDGSEFKGHMIKVKVDR